MGNGTTRLFRGVGKSDDLIFARNLIGYLERNAHRMEDPEYLAHGWCIGSGAVESACKTVVGQRLKLAGMRWGEDGSHAVCHLRALYRSEKGLWESFWARDDSTN